MMDKKWTQGKWSVYEVEGVTHWPGIEAGSSSVVIWGDSNELAGVQAESLDEARANAHLIAAAPDLYEALEKLSDACDAMAEATNSSICDDHITVARAALTKARGETQ